MSKPGRNDQCHCGSGRKYKKCHGVRADASRGRLMMLAVGAAVLAAVAAAIMSFTGERGTAATRVWSTEHGHYHDASGTAVP
jgi:hypothetical protein